MNDQHIIVIATIAQDCLLLASAILIAWYLFETKKMRKAAEAQVETAFRAGGHCLARGLAGESPDFGEHRERPCHGG